MKYLIKRCPFTFVVGFALIFTGLLPLVGYFVQYGWAVDRQLAIGREDLVKSAKQLSELLDKGLEEVETSTKYAAREAANLLSPAVQLKATIDTDKLLTNVNSTYKWEQYKVQDLKTGKWRAKVFLTRTGRQPSGNSAGIFDTPGVPANLDPISNVFLNAWAFLDPVADRGLIVALETQYDNKEEVPDLVGRTVTALARLGGEPKEMLLRACRDVCLTDRLDECFTRIKVQPSRIGPSDAGVGVGTPSEYTGISERSFLKIRTSWLYLTTGDGLMRIYPYHGNESQPWSWKPETMPYVTLPAKKKEAVWTPAYWDTAGEGFMVTYSVPIEGRRGEPVRVVSYDVTLQQIEELLESNLNRGLDEGSSFFLLDGAGGILLFEGHRYSNTYWDGKSVEYRPDDPKANAEHVLRWLGANKPWLQPHVSSIISPGARRAGYPRLLKDLRDDRGKFWNIAWEPVHRTGWRLAVLRTNDRVAAISDFWKWTVLFACIAGLLVTMVGVGLAEFISHDLRKLNLVLDETDGRADAIAGRLRAVAESSAPEISRVARSIARYAESERGAASRERRAANELRELAAVVRHEVGTPLMNINEYPLIQIYVDEILGGVFQRTAGEVDPPVLSAAENLRELTAHMAAAAERINDCLDMLRNDDGTAVEWEQCDVEGMIRRAVRWASARRTGLERLVRIRCDLQVSLSCHRVRLTRALSNLLVNSGEAVHRKYGSEQDGQILVSAVDLGDCVQFEVRDSGDGIAAEVLPRLFERGFSTNGGEGRGYGLSVVREIVEEDHQGKIAVESTPNEGTTVTVLIPKFVDSPRGRGHALLLVR